MKLCAGQFIFDIENNSILIVGGACKYLLHILNCDSTTNCICYTCSNIETNELATLTLYNSGNITLSKDNVIIIDETVNSSDTIPINLNINIDHSKTVNAAANKSSDIADSISKKILKFILFSIISISVIFAVVIIYNKLLNTQRIYNKWQLSGVSDNHKYKEIDSSSSLIWQFNNNGTSLFSYDSNGDNKYEDNEVSHINFVIENNKLILPNGKCYSIIFDSDHLILRETDNNGNQEDMYFSKINN